MEDEYFNHKLVYTRLMPHEKKIWDVCQAMLDIGLKPTQTRINEILQRPKRRHLNGRESAIKNQLLWDNGYEPVTKDSFRRTYTRWEKVNGTSNL